MYTEHNARQAVDSNVWGQPRHPGPAAARGYARTPQTYFELSQAPLRVPFPRVWTLSPSPPAFGELPTAAALQAANGPPLPLSDSTRDPRPSTGAQASLPPAASLPDDGAPSTLEALEARPLQDPLPQEPSSVAATDAHRPGSWWFWRTAAAAGIWRRTGTPPRNPVTAAAAEQASVPPASPAAAGSPTTLGVQEPAAGTALAPTVANGSRHDNVHQQPQQQQQQGQQQGPQPTSAPRSTQQGGQYIEVQARVWRDLTFQNLQRTRRLVQQAQHAAGTSGHSAGTWARGQAAAEAAVAAITGPGPIFGRLAVLDEQVALRPPLPSTAAGGVGAAVTAATPEPLVRVVTVSPPMSGIYVTARLVPASAAEVYDIRRVWVLDNDTCEKCCLVPRHHTTATAVIATTASAVATSQTAASGEIRGPNSGDGDGDFIGSGGAERSAERRHAAHPHAHTHAHALLDSVDSRFGSRRRSGGGSSGGGGASSAAGGSGGGSRTSARHTSAHTSAGQRLPGASAPAPASLSGSSSNAHLGTSGGASGPGQASSRTSSPGAAHVAASQAWRTLTSRLGSGVWGAGRTRPMTPLPAAGAAAPERETEVEGASVTCRGPPWAVGSSVDVVVQLVHRRTGERVLLRDTDVSVGVEVVFREREVAWLLMTLWLHLLDVVLLAPLRTALLGPLIGLRALIRWRQGRVREGVPATAQ